MSGLLGLFRSSPQERVKTGYAALSDEALLGLIFTEGDRLPMDFAREAIARGERLVPALAEAALDPRNHDRGDSGWCSAIHASFLLGAIGSPKAAEALLEAFDISDDMDNDWINDEWASIFGRLGPQVLEALKGRAAEYGLDCCFRHRAMCGLAAVALRHPERKAEVFDFIAGIASDAGDDPEARIWAGDILLDFRLKEHEGLLLALVELPENDFFHPDDVREALSKKEPDLYWYQRDWLDFYSEKELAERRKRWEGTRLSEDEAWQAAAKDNLFYNTTAAGIIVVLNKAKPKDRKGKVLMINTSGEFEKGRPKNYLTEAAIEKIAAAFHSGKNVERLAQAVKTGEIGGKNDFNLSPSRYIETAVVTEHRNIQDVLDDLAKLRKEAAGHDGELRRVFEGLGYKYARGGSL